MASSIQSAPHKAQTLAGTSLITTIPKPSSTVIVVLPGALSPPHKGQLVVLSEVIIVGSWQLAVFEVLSEIEKQRLG